MAGPRFYTGAQAAGDVLREIVAGLRTGRADALAQRERLLAEQRYADQLARQDEERTYQRGRDAAADERQRGLDARAGELSNVQLAQAVAELRGRGIMRGPAPEAPTVAMPIPMGLPGVGAPVVTPMRDTTRYADLGNGFYQDRDATPEAKAAARQRLVARIAQRALAGDEAAIGEGIAQGMEVADALRLDPRQRPGTPQALAVRRAEGEVDDAFDARRQGRQVAGQLRLARENNAAQSAREREKAAGATASLKPVPPKVVEQTLDAESLVVELDRASELLGSPAGKGAVGLVDGLLPTRMLRGEEGKQLRSVVSNVNSAITKLRSGTAVSASEAERLADFMISKFDDEETMQVKINGLREYLSQRAQDNRTVYSPEYGYRPLPAPRRAAPKAGSGAGAGAATPTTPVRGTGEASPTRSRNAVPY